MITQKDIKQNFIYHNGNLIWKNPSGKAKQKEFAGSFDKEGYVIIRLNGKAYKAHRLIFLLHHGFLPKMIDHIDGNPANNKIENLREATNSQNQMNSKLHVKNTSGYRGVSWHKGGKKWEARASINKKLTYLGQFDDPKDAYKAFCEATKKHFGEFANV